MADSKVFDVKFHFSMSKSPWGQVLSRFGRIGDGFIRGQFFKKCVFLIRSWGYVNLDMAGKTIGKENVKNP